MMKPIGSSGQPSYDQLLAENQRLRQQLASQQQAPPGIHLDLQQERVTIRGLESPSMKLHKLDVQMPGLKEAVPQLMDIASSVGGDGKFSMPDLSAFARFPMKVEKLNMSVSEKTVNQILAQTPVEGMSDLNLKIGQNGRIALRGMARKLIPVPFEVKGQLIANGSSEVRFRLDKTKVAGFLPVPNLMTNFFASFASREMAKMHVRQQGDDYIVNLKGLMPDNLSLQVDDITSQAGTLFIHKD